MKRRLLAVVSLAALMTLSACSGGTPSAGGSASSAAAGSGGVLNVYTPNEQNMLDALIPVFESDTGIKVNLVTAGTGELYTRIQNEAANPQGDVMFGDISTQAISHADLYQDYTSTENANMDPLGQNIGGYSTPYQIQCSVLLVNTSTIGDIQVNGYADLLNPQLKGQIAFGDPTNSSSAFAQLTNMLADMGGQASMDDNYTATPGWNYVSQLLQQTGGQVIGSSNQVGQNVSEGEDKVGLTYEPLATDYVQAGSPVKIVYPSEGTSCLPTGVEIIKGAKNLDNAKKFCDWMESQTAQQIIADKTTGRPLRTGITKQGVPALSDIVTVHEDLAYVGAHQTDLTTQYKAVLAKVAG